MLESLQNLHFTFYTSIKLKLCTFYLHHLRRMPHDINTGTLADRQMSHTNKPEVGLLNRVTENKGEAYMYPFYQDLCSTQSFYFWCNFQTMKML